MQVSGYIPERITYIGSNPRTVKAVDWEDDESKGEDEDPLGKDEFYIPPPNPNLFVVKPAFISDSSNAKVIATGKSWAGQNPEISEGPNTPISGVKILGFEHRDQGGRAFKALLPSGYWVDMRDDNMLDAIANGGILPGGFLIGEYLWAVTKSERKLVRIGSALHKAVVDGTRRRGLKKISMKNVEIGGIYSTVPGQLWVYLGKGSAIGQGYKRVSNVDIWFKQSKYINATNVQMLFERGYGWEFNRGIPPIVEKTGKFDLPDTLFADARAFIAKKTEEDVKQQLEQNQKNMIAHPQWNKPTSEKEILERYWFCLQVATVTKPEEPPYQPHGIIKEWFNAKAERVIVS